MIRNKQNDNISPLLRKQPRARPVMQRPPMSNDLLNIDLHESFRLSNEDYSVLGRFTIQDNFKAMVSLQLCFENLVEGTSLKYMQYGVCLEDCFDQNFNSIMVFNDLPKDFLICESFTFLDNFRKGDKIIVWCNLSSSNNRNINYKKDMSKLIINKL